MQMDLVMKVNIDFLVQRAKKPTSNIPTKMFDPSKDRSWPKFLDQTLIWLKNFEFKGGYWMYKLKTPVH